MKVGLLGAGYILDSHATALAATPGVSIHAVADTSRGRATRAAARFGIPHVFGSLDEMAHSDCDVVHVLLPPALHLQAAAQLLECGKGIFLEKPMGLDSTACAAICELAAQKGLPLGVNHNFLFSEGYEALREGFKRGELGRADQLSVSWHFALPILQFGPFDNWMLAAPANTLFELGSHLAAFVVDLVGSTHVDCAVAGNPLTLPAGQTVFRHWTAVAHAGAATVTLSLSLTQGQADRILRLRARGGSMQLDFGRDIGWREFTLSDNPIFDAHAIATGSARSKRRDARRQLLRRLSAALAKRPDANPFEASVFRSIQAFYAGGLRRIDARHGGELATEAIRLCESIAAAAGAGTPTLSSVSVPVAAPVASPSVLVVGGTGFIGRRLVRRLVEQGYGVRVLTRNVRAAAIEFEGTPVELVAGSHGDREAVRGALSGIRAVYHLAKCEGKRWQDYLDGDVEPTRVLGEESVAAGVERFIYTGTIASYASAAANDRIDNRTGVDPAIERRGHYARSKAACERLLQSLSRERGLRLVIVRPGIVIGPGSPPWHPGVANFSSETRAFYWGDGTNALPLVLVDDVAEALVRALQTPGIDGETLLLTSPPLLTAREYLQALSQCMGTKIEVATRSAWRSWAADMLKELAKNAVRHPNRRWPSVHDWACHSHRSRYDSAMTQQMLGWQPVADRDTMIRRGIAEAVDWFMR
ncbi:MAG TPA: NAD-dependent epimerase/dehydratase family protein [Steroidobacteraceae bacterium]|nr:NAD-dependent epimerase/dehydratase family protein [Steroidobacteraceae bacterium]